MRWCWSRTLSSSVCVNITWWEGLHWVLTQGEGARLVQAGQDCGDVQQEAAGAREAHQGDCWSCVGGRLSIWSEGGGGGLPHVHGEDVHYLRYE